MQRKANKLLKPTYNERGQMMQKLLVVIGILGALMYFVPKAIKFATDQIMGTLEQRLCENAANHALNQFSQIGRDFTYLPPYLNAVEFEKLNADSLLPKEIKFVLPSYLNGTNHVRVAGGSPFHINNIKLRASAPSVLHQIYNQFPSSCQESLSDTQGADFSHLINGSKLQDPKLFIKVNSIENTYSQDKETCAARPLRVRPQSGTNTLSDPENRDLLPPVKAGFYVEANVSYPSDGDIETCSASRSFLFESDLYNASNAPEIRVARKRGSTLQLNYSFGSIEPGSVILCRNTVALKTSPWRLCTESQFLTSKPRVLNWNFDLRSRSGKLNLLFVTSSLARNNLGPIIFESLTVDPAGNASKIGRVSIQ